ncbi:MAG: TMEM175 family protein [Armatimonadota bacterium]|nr:TMEM175 family protein [Armatimonadota bacterium]
MLPAEGSEDSPSGRTYETGRIEAFSDGMFAIAMTLLVLDLKVPPVMDHGPRLLPLLLKQWPSYVAFLTSFAFIGIMWINHHRLFSLIQRSDHGLLLLNGLLLLGVTIIPFPTQLLATYVGHRDQNVAAMVYNGVYVFLALFFNLLWRYASHNNRLLDERADPQSVRAITQAYALGPLFYLATFVISIFSVPVSLVANLLLAAFFALPERHQFKLTP